jgi:hypothetical protein
VQGQEWNPDIWFVGEPDRRPYRARLQAPLPRLTPATRAAILRVKRGWAVRAEYGEAEKNIDIYWSVPDDRVRVPMQFDEWRARPET